MKALVAVALLLSLAAPAFARDNHDLPFNNTLRDKILVLRGLYRSDKLRFTSDGTLVGSGEKGLGPTDATFHVRRIEYVPQAVFLYGDLPVMYYDVVSGNLSFKPGTVEREVSIEVSDSTDQATIERALWNVFFRPGDSMPGGCSPEEKQYYQVLSQPGHVNHPDDTYPATGLCLPYGERILYKAPVTATIPRAKSTPEPQFPADAPRERKIDGTVIVGFVINELGDVSTISVLKPMQEPFDRAAVATVLTWKFRPALHEGRPVPVYIQAELSFRRY